jgi:hypothetical protein
MGNIDINEMDIKEDIKMEVELEDSSDDSTDPIMSDPFDPVKIQIQSKPDTLRNIIERLNHDEIDMNSDFQRHADLWTAAKMSRLIESILIRFPLPAFYFDVSDDDKWLIVDGLQRLSSIRKFVVDKKLKLSGLEYLDTLRGCSYDDLPRQYKRRIDECPITMFQIMPGTPKEVKYSVFRRINTGGLVLNNQEIRNALAKGKERGFLEKLAKNKYLIKSIGDQSRRMTDQELILRFIAFYKQDFVNSKMSIATFLDDAMRRTGKMKDSSLDKLEDTYNEAIKTCYSIFGKSVFEKRTLADIKRKRKNSSLFEVWMVSIAHLDQEQRAQLIKKNEKMKTKFSELINDEAFYRSISLATQKHDHVKTRYEKIQKLIQEVLSD